MTVADAARTVRATALVYGREPSPREIAVPVEVPVEVAFGGVSFAVMMLSPSDLEDFGVGFSLTEGVVGSLADIRGVEVEELEAGWRIDLAVAPDRMAGHLARKRALSGRTGCGLCGIEDIAALGSRESRPVTAPRATMDAVRRAVSGIEDGQALNRVTRAVHAAAWADGNGRITHLREDVGRHNALDKLVGALLRDGVDPASGFAVITSRCSFEMVDKAAAYGAGMIVAVSAPTSLALDRADRLGMTLVAVARRDGAVVFAGCERLIAEREVMA